MRSTLSDSCERCSASFHTADSVRPPRRIVVSRLARSAQSRVLRSVPVAIVALLWTPSALGAEQSGASNSRARIYAGVGYFNSSNLITAEVDGIPATHASDDIVADLGLRGPLLWKQVYPYANLKWRFHDVYESDELYDNRAFVEAGGAILGAGVGVLLQLGQAEIGLRTGIGYSWESLTLDYTDLIGDSIDLDNDGAAWLVGASITFPFVGRVGALMGYELIIREDASIDGTFSDGSGFHVESGGLAHSFIVGIDVRLSKE